MMTGIRKGTDLGLIGDHVGWERLLGFAIDKLSKVEGSGVWYQ